MLDTTQPFADRKKSVLGGGCVTLSPKSKSSHLPLGLPLREYRRPAGEAQIAAASSSNRHYRKLSKIVCVSQLGDDTPKGK